ncbi:MAG TPA: FAD binding domain-containing protein [Rectinemataceae bacterium]|nr:FAD binding domain-containing protein [Rectinemataceae bacterium]
MVKAYFRPKTAGEALELLSSEEGAVLLAGGTYLMTSQFAERPMTAIAIMNLVPKGIERHGDRIIIGAGATFQDIADSALLPTALREAALSMADRNIRNRATIGGNIGADKSCSSLLPFLLVAEARYSRAQAPALTAAEWQAADPAEKGLIAGIEFELPASRRFAVGRYARTSCDVAVLTCAASAEVVNEGPSPRGLSHLRIAMGGLSPHARRFPELESLFEGVPLPDIAAIEAAAAPRFAPVDDVRGGAAFKRLRAAALLADVLFSLEASL